MDTEDDARSHWAEWVRDADELIMRGHAFYSTPIADIISTRLVICQLCPVSHSPLDASGRDKWCPVYESGSLFELIEVFASGDIHRVPLWRDETHIIHSIITQVPIFLFPSLFVLFSTRIRFCHLSLPSYNPPPVGLFFTLFWTVSGSQFSVDRPLTSIAVSHVY